MTIRPTLDIRVKLAGLFFVVAGAIVVSLTLYFSSRLVADARAGLESKGRAYAQFVSRAVEPAVAFNDRQTARELLDATALDPDVRAIALYGEDGHVIGAVGKTTAPNLRAREVVVSATHDAITCTAPVISREGPRGTLVVDMSLASIHAEKMHVLFISIGAGALSLVVGFLGAWWVGGSLSRRLRTIQSATRAVATGELSVPVLVDSSKDEVGRLARDFNAMASGLRNLVNTIERNAADEQARLDALVTERTAELQLRHSDMRRVLERVDQGFLTVTRDGTMLAERSAILTRWFGAADKSDTLWDYVGRCAPGIIASLWIGWEALFEGFLSLDLLLDQLPKKAFAEGRVYSLCYYPVFEGESFSRVVVVVSDVTAEIARERAESAQRELASLCARVMRDPGAVQEFLAEGKALISALTEDDDAPIAELKRNLHTLKGNAGFFGLERLVAACHDSEHVSIETGERPSRDSLAVIASLFAEVSQIISPLETERRDVVLVPRVELEALADAASSASSRAALARSIRRMCLEPTEQKLTRLAEQTRVLARRLGKSDVIVRIEHNDVRLDHARWAPFWTALVHVVRNAVDHGLEDASERQSSGKIGSGAITFRTIRRTGEHVVEVEDDGRGIDWNALEEHAIAMGVDLKRVDRRELPFLPGVSTKDDVTEISGRGVGLDAMRAVCTSLGGSIEIATTKGKGTCFTFRFPDRLREATAVTDLAALGSSSADCRPKSCTAAANIRSTEELLISKSTRRARRYSCADDSGGRSSNVRLGLRI